jgi:hypothetical protein
MTPHAIKIVVIVLTLSTASQAAGVVAIKPAIAPLLAGFAAHSSYARGFESAVNVLKDVARWDKPTIWNAENRVTRVVEPALPSPLEHIRVSGAQFALGLMAAPKTFKDHELSLAGSVSAETLEALRAAALASEKNRALRKTLQNVQSTVGTVDLNDARSIEASAKLLSILYENASDTFDRPDVLAGKFVPRPASFKKESIKEWTVANGIIRARTKSYHLKAGIRYSYQQDITDIARALRADMSRAVARGDIPEGKYSVRTSRFNQGESLTIELHGYRAPPKTKDSLRDALREMAERYVGGWDYNGPGDPMSGGTYVNVNIW